MKNFILLAMLAVLGGTGCAHQYKLVLTNGSQVTAPHKPKLEHGFYKFKDVHGKEVIIPEGRVMEVGPASMISNKKDAFKGETRH